MKRLIASLLLVIPLLARAQTTGSDQDAYSQPPIPQPEVAPPPPPETPAPPAADAAQQAPVPYVQQAPAPSPSGAGQWVYTTQYGWIWMPYGDSYTYVPVGGEAPDMYVYYPAFGWRWVVAPWVWGLGPRPYFGVVGFARFGWYGHGFGRWYGFAPRYAGWGGRGYWAGGRWSAPHVVYGRPHVVVHGGYGGGHVVHGGYGGGHAVHGGNPGHR